MRSMFRLLLALVTLGISGLAFADNICGDPPLLENSSLKGELTGKAQLLSKFVGDVQLTGKIETSRTEVLTKYPDAERTRGNAYFEYQICVVIMNDKSMSTQQKLDELRKTRREFQKPFSPLSQNEIDQLAEVRTQCENGEFRQAKSTLSKLTMKFPDEKSILQIKRQCENLSDTPQDFDVTLEIAPGVFLLDERGQAFASFSLRIEGSYCGHLSNTHEAQTVSCSALPGTRRFVLSSLRTYDSDRDVVTSEASCGGQFTVKPSVEKYGVLICMKKPNIICGIVPTDADYLAFNKNLCKFRSEG